MSDAARVAPRSSSSAGATGSSAAEHSGIALPTFARSASRWRPSRVACAALLLGLAVTGAFAVISRVLYDHNESHLLRLRARQVSSVLSAAVPSFQSTLASAAALADATNGDPQRFRVFMKQYAGPGRQFASASLWPLHAAKLAPTAVVGPPPLLASLPAQAHDLFAHGEHSPLLNITGILGSAHPSLGFEFSTPGVSHGFAVYVENRLPKDRRSRLAGNSAFSDLNYALYLGHSRSHNNLLVTSLHHFPISGRQASAVVPFGNSVFTVIVTPNGPLGGTFFADLPWIIVIVGVLISLVAASLTDRLARRRQHAEQLTGILDRVAAENHQLYTEQRGIAQTLQHALLPDVLPDFSDLQVGVRYVPAASGVDVGGDWYDVVATDDRRVLLVIGDVSGHGLHAATTMALLRHATLAYAAEVRSPASVLAKLSEFVNRGSHDYFATVLCALIDPEAHLMTIASAGHLAPLLIDDGGGRYVELSPNVPIGVPRDSEYRETTVNIAPHSTLVAFTDGLVERRGEVLDAGLARLREVATAQRLAPDELVATLTRDVASQGHQDDTAIVVIKWQT